MKGNIWAQVLERLSTSVKRHEFVKWLQPTSLGAIDGNIIEVRVPDENSAKWIRKHYGTAIQEALAALGRSDAQASFVVGPPVSDAKPSKPGKGPQGKALDFEVIESWERDVDGAELLDNLTQAFERFVTLPPHASTALALWVLHTYTHDAAFFSPVIAITSPMPGCGKTSVLIVLGSLVHKRQYASNLTSSVLFRLVDRFQPTLLIDEADTFLPDNDQLRGLLNSGHMKSAAWLIRTVGDDYDPRKFHTWCPKAIAAIGRLPRTLEDRSIQIRMRRQCASDAGYRTERLRQDRVDGWHLSLRQRAARWADDHLDELREADPEVPRLLPDRPADCWRPLLAIADVAGGDWPQRARQAAEAMSGDAFNDDQEPGVELLRDLHALLCPSPEASGGLPALVPVAQGLLATADLVKALTALPDRPWSTWRGDKPITPFALSKLLKPLSVNPTGPFRVGTELVRGYRLEAFEDAFTRYLPFSVVTRNKTNVYGPKSQNPVVTNPSFVTTEKHENRPVNIDFVTPVRLKPGKRGVIPMIPALQGSLKRAESGHHTGPSRVQSRPSVAGRKSR